MYRIMIRDNMSPVAKEILEATGKIEVVVDNDPGTSSAEKLSGLIKGFHGLAVRSGTKVTETVLAHADDLRVIGRAGIGVDNIDVKAATARGVVVMNAPGGNTVTTAEHAIAMMLSLARNIPQATASIRSGLWEKKKLGGVEITGKTLGIIGLGHIGTVVAERAQGLKMKVLASDPYISKEAAGKRGVELVKPDELMARADFISLHVPRMTETTNMINADTLSRMKKGVRIINCSRGEVVDLDALYAALETGQVQGAALDVFPSEPPESSLPILQHPRAIFTPHLGASTGEAQEKVAEMIAHQIAAYLLDDVISHAINFPSVSREVMEKISPYLGLAEKLGSLMGQLVGQTHQVTLHYTGEVAEMETRPLTHAVLKGLLGAYTDTPVNYVNAPALAADKGIVHKEILSASQDDFTGLIKIQLDGAGEMVPNEVWGTLFARKHPRIVRLGRIYMDAIPEGSIIIIQNIDKPGVIGNVGGTLGRNNINIARFQLGRREDRALCMVNVDTPASDRVLDEIRRLPNILAVQQVDLG